MIVLILRMAIPLILFAAMFVGIIIVVPKIIRGLSKVTTNDTIAEKEDEMSAARQIHDLAEKGRKVSADIAGEEGDLEETVAQDSVDAGKATRAGRQAQDSISEL